MKIIAHRGNLNGPNPLTENDPKRITQCIEDGYDVEIDVWYMDGDWFVGHDEPLYRIELEFLKQKGLWCHAKNIESLYELIQISDEINCFWHQTDDVTLTSFGFLWTYPGKNLTPKSIAVLPEKKKFKNIKFNGGGDGCDPTVNNNHTDAFSNKKEKWDKNLLEELSNIRP